MRQIRFTEPQSALDVRCGLLDEAAPRSAEFLWQLAVGRLAFPAIHAIWTGPELSCPLPASALPDALAADTIPAENATSFPEAGDVVLASIAAGAVKGLPPGNFFDLGIFYGTGGRLLMPFGWIQANVCARVVGSDMAQLQACMRKIRNGGECRLGVEPVE